MYKKSIRSAIMFAAVAMALAGCGKKEVAFDTLEDARSQARANALWNAKMYVAENPRFDNHQIVSHGDSSQTPDCPQGDGWASVSIMKLLEKEPGQAKGVVEKFTAKCSTVSGTVGCYLDADFKKKPYANEDGQCQPTSKVPFPLPKIAK
jgi:hypothetical protein